MWETCDWKGKGGRVGESGLRGGTVINHPSTSLKRAFQLGEGSEGLNARPRASSHSRADPRERKDIPGLFRATEQKKEGRLGAGGGGEGAGDQWSLKHRRPPFGTCPASSPPPPPPPPRFSHSDPPASTPSSPLVKMSDKQLGIFTDEHCTL